MHVKLLFSALKRMPLMTHVKNIFFGILPFVVCGLLLVTSSCFFRYDRDGYHDGHDHDQHHDQEKYDRNRDRDHHGMNYKQDKFVCSEISGQGEKNGSL